MDGKKKQDRIAEIIRQASKGVAEQVPAAGFGAVTVNIKRLVVRCPGFGDCSSSGSGDPGGRPTAAKE